MKANNIIQIISFGTHIDVMIGGHTIKQVRNYKIKKSAGKPTELNLTIIVDDLKVSRHEPT